MLEGKEFEKQLSEYGSVFVDVTPEGLINLGVTAKIDLVAEIKKLAAKTETTLDDQFIAVLEGLLKPKK